MIAFHFPPVARSSGVHRTLKFAQYLRDYGWKPIILTVNNRAHEWCDTQTIHDLEGIVVERAFALDAARHFSILGKYPAWLSRPDRWASWYYPAIFAGKKLIRQYKPEIIWSTYPVATAHMIGQSIHESTRIPWIADFRDTMTDPDYPKDPLLKRIYRKIENEVLHQCQHAVFTTEESRSMYIKSYPDIPESRLSVIPNGYDEELFQEVEGEIKGFNYHHSSSGKLCFVHSGLLYQDERNPEPFFNAISDMKKNNDISRDNIKIILRASGNDEFYNYFIKKLDIDDIVFIEPALPYKEALKEMLYADGLLVFQAENCDHQIPAKIYEYFRARKPIFGIVSTTGCTASLLKAVGIESIADIKSPEQIRTGLNHFIQMIKHNSANVPVMEKIEGYSRQNASRTLAQLLEKI